MIFSLKNIIIFYLCTTAMGGLGDEPDMVKKYISLFSKEMKISDYKKNLDKNSDNIKRYSGSFYIGEKKYNMIYSDDLQQIKVDLAYYPGDDEQFKKEPVYLREKIFDRAKKDGEVFFSLPNVNLGEPEIRWAEYCHQGGPQWIVTWQKLTEDGIPYQHDLDCVALSYNSKQELVYITQSFVTRKILNKSIKVDKKAGLKKTRAFAEDLLEKGYPNSNVGIELKDVYPMVINLSYVMDPIKRNLVSDAETEGLLAWKYLYKLKEKIKTKSGKHEYAITEIYVYVDAETGKIAAYDHLGW